MAEPYIGEIRIFAGTFAPQGWAFCDGSLLSIGSYEALFTLIGTTYGGDGQQTFALPDLRGRAPVSAGAAPGLTPRDLGETDGREQVVLTGAEAPAHAHAWRTAATAGTSKLPGGYYANGAALSFAAGGEPTPLAASTVASAGGGQPHENMPPFLAVSFIIALEGIYPSQEA